MKVWTLREWWELEKQVLLMRCKGREGGKDDPKVLGTNYLSHLCEYILPALSKHCSVHCFGELHKDSMLVCGGCRFLTPDPSSFTLLYMEPCSLHCLNSGTLLLNPSGQSLNITSSVKPSLNNLGRVKSFFLQASLAPYLTAFGTLL